MKLLILFNRLIKINLLILIIGANIQLNAMEQEIQLSEFRWGDADNQYWRINLHYIDACQEALSNIEQKQIRESIQTIFSYSDYQRARNELSTEDEFTKKQYLNRFTNDNTPQETIATFKSIAREEHQKILHRINARNWDVENFDILISALVNLPLLQEISIGSVMNNIPWRRDPSININVSSFTNEEALQIIDLMKKTGFLEINISQRSDIVFSYQDYVMQKLNNSPHLRRIVLGCGNLFRERHKHENSLLLDNHWYIKPDLIANALDTSFWKMLPSNYFDEIFDESNTCGMLISKETLPEMLRILKPDGKLSIDANANAVKKILSQLNVDALNLTEEDLSKIYGYKREKTSVIAHEISLRNNNTEF